jgi:hypothetical protein
MGSFANEIVRVAGPSLWMGQQLLKDVKPAIFARKPLAAGKSIDTNHPAFVYGHLSLYPAKLMQAMDLDPSSGAVPPAYAELFEAGKQCHDDPNGQIYPPMEEVTGNFFRAYNAVVEGIKTLPDETFARPTPGEGRMKEMFPQVGGFLLFMLGSHPMLHLGQVSAWRRFYGLGPVM